MKEAVLEKKFLENINNYEHFQWISLIVLLYVILLFSVYILTSSIFQGISTVSTQNTNYPLVKVNVLGASNNSLNSFTPPGDFLANYSFLPPDKREESSFYIASDEEKKEILAAIQEEKERIRQEKIKKQELAEKRRRDKEYAIRGYSVVTAYSSDIYQCDSTPCITANGFNVCNHNIMDTIAANHLSFGTKVKMPELFGDRVFIVRDRMNRRYTDRVDIWMTDRDDALKFGIKKTAIYVKVYSNIFFD